MPRLWRNKEVNVPDVEGTFSRLSEVAQTPPPPGPGAKKEPKPDGPAEDLSTVPYVSQNYRFTEDELRWIRKQAYDLTEQLGGKVSQNTILRIALRHLRNECERNSHKNPLVDAATQLKK